MLHSPDVYPGAISMLHSLDAYPRAISMLHSLDVYPGAKAMILSLDECILLFSEPNNLPNDLLSILDEEKLDVFNPGMSMAIKDDLIFPNFVAKV